MSKKHEWLHNKALKKKWINILKKHWENEPLQPVQFQMNIYFAMAIRVLSNPYWHYLYNYLLAEYDTIQLCSSSENFHLSGGGIFCIFLDGSRILFKYDLLMYIMKTLQFWNNKPAKRITIIQRRVMGMKNPWTKNGLAQSYMNEAYGNSLLSQAICDVFEAKTKEFKGNIISSVVNHSDLLSRCITEIFSCFLISMLHTLFLFIIASNLLISVFHHNILLISIPLFVLLMIFQKNACWTVM